MRDILIELQNIPTFRDIKGEHKTKVKTVYDIHRLKWR
jgi:hypothetical protein